MPETIGPIQGITPDSIEEYRVAVSLTKYGWEFYFQYPIAGGKRVRGGMVPDFLVFTVPKATCLYVQGPYFHGSKQEDKDRLQQAMIFSMDFLVETVTTDLLETQDESDATILKIFGRGG